MRDSTRGSIRRILDSAGMGARPVNAFVDYPALERMAQQFVNFVSPWLVVDEENLAERTLLNAIRAYDKSLPEGYETSRRRFVEQIAVCARTLASADISVQNHDGVWVHWNYDEPLMRYLASHDRRTVQIRKRKTPLLTTPIMIKLLAAVCPSSELEAAGIDYPALLATGEHVERKPS